MLTQFLIGLKHSKSFHPCKMSTGTQIFKFYIELKFIAVNGIQVRV